MHGEARDNVRIALDLYEVGEQMMTQTLRRRHPEASEEEIEALLVAWLRDRPSLSEVDGFRKRDLASLLENARDDTTNSG